VRFISYLLISGRNWSSRTSSRPRDPFPDSGGQERALRQGLAQLLTEKQGHAGVTTRNPSSRTDSVLFQNCPEGSGPGQPALGLQKIIHGPAGFCVSWNSDVTFLEKRHVTRSSITDRSTAWWSRLLRTFRPAWLNCN